MTTEIPTICHGCGSALSSTVFCEDGKPYHFGCRPSQRADTTFRSQREHNDLLARIAELEAELAVSKRLNGKWMDERTTALMRAEVAEKHLSSPEFMDRRLWQARALQAEAEVARLRRLFGMEVKP